MSFATRRRRLSPERFIGQTLPGGVELQEFIGSGAFAYVYRGVEKGSQVAVKVLVDVQPAARKRFDRELKVLQLLTDNPYVIRYIRRGRTRENLPFMVMEFVQGYTLRQMIDSGHTLDSDKVATLMLQLCQAFTGLHRLGVTHGDVCPSNIIITGGGSRAKVCDFGLARDSQGLLKFFEEERMVEGDEFAENIDQGVLMGTPAYMAPEQITDALSDDPNAQDMTDTPADVYALGTLMYELLAGQPPFPFKPAAPSGNKYRNDAVAYLTGRLATPNASQPQLEIEPGLWTIIQRAMMWDQKMRYGDAREMQASLERFLGNDSGPEHVIGLSDSTVRRTTTVPGADKPRETRPTPHQAVSAELDIHVHTVKTRAAPVPDDVPEAPAEPKMTPAPPAPSWRRRAVGVFSFAVGVIVALMILRAFDI